MNQDANESSNPYTTPSTRTSHRELQGRDFIGFAPRGCALLLDVFWMLPVTMGITYFYAGAGNYFDPDRVQSLQEQLVSNLVIGGLVVAFWKWKAATPGKLALSIKVVDYETGEDPSIGQLIGRYFAYIPSGLALGLGYLSVLWDSERRSWHDKMSGTAVVRR